MNQPAWRQFVETELDGLACNQLLRSRVVTRPVDSTHVERDGRRLTNFASNDYLGLTHHPRVIAAAAAALAANGAGAGASSLICGYGPHHASAEAALAAWKGAEAAVLLPSGYHANLAAVQTLAALGAKRAGGVRFLIDKLAHASLIDAVRGSGQPWRVFPHNHMAKLRRLLEDAPEASLQIVVTESIFSMDGDAADLPAIVELKRRFPFLLLLDEAHASGVYGVNGRGLAHERGLEQHVDVSVLTLSKALGGAGGAVCGSRVLCAALINFGRAAIFTTNLPAAAAAAAEAALRVLRDEPQRQARVRDLARRVRSSLATKGLQIPAGDAPIIPVILGQERLALHASEALLEKGMLVVAVRPPTVPRGSSRLRLTLSCDHTDEEVENLTAAVGQVAVAR